MRASLTRASLARARKREHESERERKRKRESERASERASEQEREIITIAPCAAGAAEQEHRSCC
jgi:hypothetical protein